VKLYADEPDHAVVRGLAAVVVSALARVEVPAALWRKQRLGQLSPEDAGLLALAFEADFHGSGAEAPRFAAVAITTPILDAAAELVAVHPLRAYDAVQLACALAARAADPECGDFACFDGRLRHAAAGRGFRVLPSSRASLAG
jgi:predicted nucleic acid-binding protein